MVTALLLTSLLIPFQIDFSILIPPSDDSLYQTGYQDGFSVGYKIFPWRSFKNGFIGGLFFGFLGSGCITGLNYISPEVPNYTPEGSLEYKAGYYQGYKKATMQKKASYAAVGGFIGTCCNVACVVFTIYWIKEHINE